MHGFLYQYFPLGIQLLICIFVMFLLLKLLLELRVLVEKLSVFEGQVFHYFQEVLHLCLGLFVLFYVGFSGDRLASNQLNRFRVQIHGSSFWVVLFK